MSRDALFEVPCVIGDKEVRTGSVKYQLVPFEHGIKLARFYHADKATIGAAIESNLRARADWERAGVDFRANVMLRAAERLAASEDRARILAATMLGQGKTVYQAGKHKVQAGRSNKVLINKQVIFIHLKNQKMIPISQK